MTLHDPTDADYILTAVLLAIHLNGSSTDIQDWSGKFRTSVPWHRSEEREALAAAFKLREGPQMDRVVTVAERLLGVELGERAVATYCKQISSGKYQKKGNKKTENRMLAGDLGHFHLICHHLSQIGNADLGHLAGKGGRYCKAADRISMPGSTPRPSNLANMLLTAQPRLSPKPPKPQLIPQPCTPCCAARRTGVRTDYLECPAPRKSWSGGQVHVRRPQIPARLRLRVLG